MVFLLHNNNTTAKNSRKRLTYKVLAQAGEFSSRFVSAKLTFLALRTIFLVKKLQI